MKDYGHFSHLPRTTHDRLRTLGIDYDEQLSAELNTSKCHPVVYYLKHTNVLQHLGASSRLEQLEAPCGLFVNLANLIRAE